LAIGLSSRIEAELGVPVNLHLLRHFAAWLFLKRNPGAYETVRRLLGHRNINTTIKWYAGLEGNAAARQFDAAFLAERTELQARADIARAIGPARADRRSTTNRETRT
jgi:hypothetical protein